MKTICKTDRRKPFESSLDKPENTKKTLENGIDIQQRILKIISGIPVEKELALDTTIISK